MPIRPKKVSRRQATPRLGTNLPRCDGLVLRVGQPGLEANAAERLAKRVLKDFGRGEWVVRPMGAESRDVIVRRPVGQKNPTAAQSFELAQKLSAHRDVEDCEPSLFVPTDAPAAIQDEFDEMRVARADAAVRSSSSGDDDDHQPCSNDRDWSLDVCEIRQAWDLPLPQAGSAMGDGIVVGHPDTGYTRHPQLDRGRVLHRRGRDFEEGDGNPLDPLTGSHGGHGTSTGSVIMSGSDSELRGVAPLAKLVPLRVTDSVVLLSFGKLAEAIRYAADDGHHVISISLGGPVSSRFLERAVRYATRRGVIVIAAAGNVWPWVVYPARLDETIAVAACTCSRSEWSSSASGSAVDITAPGESVWRALASTSGFSVERSSGTSYATAVTAGAAALWLAFHGRDRLVRRYGEEGIPAVFKELLVTQGFVRPIGWDTRNFGAGILNVRKLLAASLPSTSPAGGMAGIRTAFPLGRPSQLDRISDLFPKIDEVAVHATARNTLNVAQQQIPAALSAIGDEFAYRAVMDMAFRKSFKEAAEQASLKRKSRANSARVDVPAVKVPRGASPTMKKMMKK